MFRRYNRWQSRFDQPDPYDGSYSLTDPQSFNRYAYVQGDPVNFTDPTGLFLCLTCPDEDEGGGTPSWWDGWDARNGGPGLTPPGGPHGDPSRGGRGDKGDRPPTDPEGKASPNSNCIQNAVLANGTSLARPFGNVGPSGSIGHDGIHVVAPPGSRVTTLPALTGTVLGPIHSADDGRTHIVDVLLDQGGFVALYKDLATVSVRPGQHLSAGTIIGTTGEGEGFAGLHFSLLNGGRQADRYYRSLTSTGQTNKIMVGMFTNPNGPNSPVRCPGVPVDNAAVNPYP